MSLSLNPQILADLASGSNVVSTSSAGEDRATKIHKAAQQFEALLVGEMLQSTREETDDGWLGSGDGAGEDSALSLAETQLANALSANGGLGLSRFIEKNLAGK